MSPAWKSLKKGARTIEEFLERWDPEPDPKEPVYDPVHFGAALLLFLVGVGALYWLLWTLLVYEGGIFLKAQAACDVLFTSKTLADYGYEAAPYAMGAFEGWLANVIALALSALALAGLHRIYWDAARRHRQEK
ncbi:MAG: hypothetical protein HY549_09515 [Elusimicrobia bacterium]|nr:hypothetical protein [Elusimicrobiota bacterium]